VRDVAGFAQRRTKRTAAPSSVKFTGMRRVFHQ
jgi:hypothetical protein